jgi:protoheme IX farnesyltransferase
MKNRLKAYYLVTKPGIIRGNAVHVLAGALLASTAGFLAWKELLGVLIGTSLIIASACVANNYMDRGIDSRMKRTKLRPSVTGTISLKNAMIYAAVLLIAGLLILYATTNAYVIAIGLTAYIIYVFVYGLAKRRTVHSTLIGAIPGALPAMAGYVAIDGQLSIGAWLVFLLVFAWQMPHFYAISLFRRQDYKDAGLPVLGVVKHIDMVKRYILAYIFLYVVAITLLIAARVVGPPAGLLLLSGAAYWVFVYFGKNTEDRKWALSIFGASLVLTLILVIAAGLNLCVGSGA